jgi:hypothetical protein
MVTETFFVLFLKSFIMMARMRFLPFIHLPLLFILPLYYAWQASDVIQQTSKSRSEYHQWVCEHTELQTIHTTMAAQDTPPSPSTTEPPSPAPESVLKAAEAWNTFVDSRVAEWKIAATFSGLFVACVYPDMIRVSRLTSTPFDLKARPSQSFRSPRQPKTL